MATLSSDGKYVTVEKGDTLWAIAAKHAGGGKNYTTLASINNISNPNLIYVGQKIYLSSTGSSSTSTTSNKAVVSMGELASSDDTLLATWTWSNTYTEKYKVLWDYQVNGNTATWFGDIKEISVDEDAKDYSKYDTFSIPSSATKVRVKVLPVSKEKESSSSSSSSTKQYYFTASWSDRKTWTNSTPLTSPEAPKVTLDKLSLTVTLDNINSDTKQIELQVYKNDTTLYDKSTVTVSSTASISHVFTLVEDGSYKVRCRAKSDNLYSEWTAYTDSVTTKPVAPSKITTCRTVRNSNNEYYVELEWEKVTSAKTYDIEYTTNKDLFDVTSDTNTVNTTGNDSKWFITSNLTSGSEHFFRVRAVNDSGESDWTDIVSTIVGCKPDVPTTWSSTTTATVGEVVKLYWIHNSKDGSSQTFAQINAYYKETEDSEPEKIIIGDIENSTDPDLKDKTSVYELNTSSYKEGGIITWSVRTSGVTNEYGDYSIERRIDIYAKPTLEVTLTDIDGNQIAKGINNSNGVSSETGVVQTFPINLKAVPGPSDSNQSPIGYHVSVITSESYETTDNVGNSMMVNSGDEVYSEYFDVKQTLETTLNASNIDLESGINYTLNIIVSMNSGLTSEVSIDFNVNWIDPLYMPNAEIAVDTDTYVAYIKPYCENGNLINYKVIKSNNTYTLSTEDAGSVFSGDIPFDGQSSVTKNYGLVSGVTTTTGELVYYGMSESGDEIYYSPIDVRTLVENVILSVYRREFDGSFKEIATNLPNDRVVSVTDPHPALDYARYRIVVTSTSTGAVSYHDIAGHPVNGKAAIIQWDEAWTNFETSEDDWPAEPSWSGSLLKLPYNLDVSESNNPDVTLVNYIGRENPVSYHGTQIGDTMNWSTDVPKDDKETLYALRRLKKWMSNVYVREPSGIGYWATIQVSLGQTHKDLVVPVSLSITRVEGGI